MRLSGSRFLQALALSGAIIVGAVIGTGVSSDWDFSSLSKAAPAEIRRAVDRQVVGRETMTNSAVRIGEAGTSPVQGRWIADVRSGPYRLQAVQVAGIREDGLAETRRIDRRAARRGFGATIRNALRKWGKAPKEERDAKLVRRSSSGSGEDEKEGNVYPGDVFLSGIPMVDQGSSAYCAVASAARVLQGYGIEISMEDMAVLAGSSETCGTCMRRWDQALRKVAGEHGLELKVIPELTETMTPLGNLLYDYNQTARDMGHDELYTWDYLDAFHADYKAFWEDREYPVQREVMLSNDRKCDAFEDNVTARIDDADPLFWSVTLGDVPEQVPYSDEVATRSERGSHMRLIIGYNEDRGEVLYSDSWGKGHELKRMDANDALSITRGMYYLAD